MTAKTKRLRAESRALEAAARVLRQEAEQIERAAVTKAELAEHLEKLAQIPHALQTVCDWIDRGCSQGEAIEHAADVFEVRADALAFYFARELETRREMRSWRRDREIMRLAWGGKTNAEIAATAKLQPKSISRIIRRKLRAGWIARQKSSPGRLQTREGAPGGTPIPPRPASRALPYSGTQTTGENLA